MWVSWGAVVEQEIGGVTQIPQRVQTWQLYLVIDDRHSGAAGVVTVGRAAVERGGRINPKKQLGGIGGEADNGGVDRHSPVGANAAAGGEPLCALPIEDVFDPIAAADLYGAAPRGPCPCRPRRDPQLVL